MSPSQVLNNAIREFREALRDDLRRKPPQPPGRAGWDLLMEWDKYSTRGFLGLSVSKNSLILGYVTNLYILQESTKDWRQEGRHTASIQLGNHRLSGDIQWVSATVRVNDQVAISPL
jgi:hypothetical protein